MVVVDRGAVSRAKPEPDLFLACGERLGLRPADCYVVGDAVWDMLGGRRAGMLTVGLLSGGAGGGGVPAGGGGRGSPGRAPRGGPPPRAGGPAPARRPR